MSNESESPEQHIYRMTLAYDGTAYNGWQMQKNAISVQQRVEEALEILLKEPTRIIASGRTDTGVHARGQVAHFKTATEVNVEELQYRLNRLLPEDIRIRVLSKAPSQFHARFSAVGKTYHYYLHLERVLDPFSRYYSHHLYQDLNRELLHLATQMFVGTHDFTSFANSASKGSAANNPVRTIYRIDVVNTEKGLCLEFEGNGFLYKMVRNIVGTCLDVAVGRRGLDDIPYIFAARDRSSASKSAPACGLFLMEVKYPIISDPKGS